MGGGRRQEGAFTEVGLERNLGEYLCIRGET